IGIADVAVVDGRDGAGLVVVSPVRILDLERAARKNLGPRAGRHRNGSRQSRGQSKKSRSESTFGSGTGFQRCEVLHAGIWLFCCCWRLSDTRLSQETWQVAGDRWF